ncbi:aminotransferase [Lichenifustis flavocetrariae]|uniref:Aminotransferase n=1 Tax=Lichenifustis flavocetrariae TaxID=2949735 RepID=A0AA42CLC2_9HYPH|nr:aminotransferase [Lichenifustis flavocetrariae]MCW6511448.1 aminotransferase [Lichenifustis flavocetrariae]
MTEMPRNFSLADMDREALFHPATSIADHLKNGPLILSDAHGARIKDQTGRVLVDLGAGLWCVNVGYGRTEIAEAAAKAITDLSFYHLFGSSSNESAIRLADRVLSLLREKAGARHLSKVFFGTSGSDANDTNYKLVRYYNNLRGKPQKKKVISRLGGYHGTTLASASMTGIPAYHVAFDLPVEGVFHTSCPHYFRFGHEGESEEAFTERLINEIKDLIRREGAETIAAFIAEPVIGSGGVCLPPVGYFARLQPILAENDILFIADEVITGFGRLGSWFGTAHFDLKPDIVTLAKGLTSAYFPVSASVISEEIWAVLEAASPQYGPVMHGSTYAGHPVGAAIGLVNLDIIERERLVENAAELGPYMLARLTERVGDHPYVGNVRGTGLMLGVEFVADKKTKRAFAAKTGPQRVVAKNAIAEGVLVRGLPYIDVNAFSPPLSITRDEIDEGVERYARALELSTPAIRDLAAQ